MKLKPNIIKYEDILANNPIKNKTEIMGFLVIITDIAQNIANIDIRSNILYK